ncbi:MAG: WG repeat-containing protein [Lachnospiraceae bacterium]|nr:WG repeat-containing protein [Lachnospiraceae bacterium]
MKKIGYIFLVILTVLLLTSCEEEGMVMEQEKTADAPYEEEGRALEQVETADASYEEEGRALEQEETADAGGFEIPAGYTAVDYNELEEEQDIEKEIEAEKESEEEWEKDLEETKPEETDKEIEEIKPEETENETEETEIETETTEVKEEGGEEAEAVEQPESSQVIDNSRWSWFIEPGEYSDIILYDENFIAVADDSDQYGFIDGEKNVIVECQYAHVAGVSEQIAIVLDSENNYLFLNADGKLITKETFEDAGNFSEGYVAVMKDGKWGFLNKSGKIAATCEYDYVTEFREGLAAVKRDESWFYIDKNGKKAFEGEYEDAQYFSEGLAAVKKDGKFGFIDRDGNVKIDFQYEDAGNFSEGKAAVSKTVDGYQEWAYINAYNEVVLDYQRYNPAEEGMLIVGEFQDGYALVTKDLYCLINEEGRKVLGNEPKFFLTPGSTYSIESGWMPAYDYTDDSMTEKKYGFVDIDGRTKVPFLFEHVSGIYGDLAEVGYKQKGKSQKGVIKLSLRSYDSHRDFPYGNMDFVDERAYAFLKKAYDELDFTGEFQTGDLDLYDKYKVKFKELLNNEITFTELKTGEEYYIDDYTGLRTYGSEKFEPSKFQYYLFDMDGDDAPELCIWDRETYIFKYYSEFGEMALWMELSSHNEHIHGTKVLNWIWDGVRYQLTRLDEQGNPVFRVYFLLEGCWSNGIETYLAALPYFYDREQIEIPAEMKEQGYFSEEDNLYLFQVTEEQFDELTQDYFDACRESEKGEKKVAFTYEELFGTDEKWEESDHALIDWTFMEPLEEYEEADYKSYGGVEVSVERTSRRITNGEGEVLAEIYYDRPVVSNAWATLEINQFFEQEEREWLMGEGRNTLYGDQNYSSFYTQFNELCELFGEERISKTPSRYTMSTRIMFLDTEILSILQIASIENMAQTSHYYYGSTFDLNSGKLLSITELAEIDADGLGEQIEELLPKDKTYNEVKGDNYLIHYYDDVIAMDYEYYYDGTDFYIILNRSAKGESYLMKWNGKRL